MRFAAIALMNVAVAGAVGLAVWVTESAWALLGLVFLIGWKSGPRRCDDCELAHRCPKCGKS